MGQKFILLLLLLAVSPEAMADKIGIRCTGFFTDRDPFNWVFILDEAASTVTEKGADGRDNTLKAKFTTKRIEFGDPELTFYWIDRVSGSFKVTLGRGFAGEATGTCTRIDVTKKIF